MPAILQKKLVKESLMKINYKTISSFLIYIVSVGALTISDFIVVGKFSSDGVSEWAFYKSVIFVFGGMCVLGFDQLLLREINYYKQFKRQFFIQSILISFIISCFLFLYIKDALKSLFCFFMLFFYANFMFEAGYWRGKKNLLLSQLNTNLWKIIILFLLGFFIYFREKYEVLYIYLYSLVLAFFCLYLINFKLKDRECLEKNILTKEQRIKYFLIGLYFFIHSFSLVIANYGEQFIINIYGNKAISSVIFSYITLYSSLVLAAIGFIGFYLGPKVRYYKDFNLKIYYKYQSIIFLMGIILILINSVMVYIFSPYFYKNIDFDLLLWTLILFLTLCRVLYVFPSLCLGVFGDEKSLKKSSFYSLIAVSGYIFLFMFLMKSNNQYMRYLIILLMITHWLCKIFVSNYYVYKCLVKRVPEYEG
jgi:O-antigen/teichoic acid export membrane protein